MTRSFLSRPIDIPKPILYYKLSSNSIVGNTVIDSMGNNNGTINPLQSRIVPMRTGEGLQIDTPGVVVSTPNSPIMQPHTGLTGVSTWHFIVNVPTGGGGHVLAKDFASPSQREFAIYISDHVLMEFTEDGVYDLVWTSPLSSIPANADTLVTIVYDGSRTPDINLVSIYINGVQQIVEHVVLNGLRAAFQPTTAPLEIGARSRTSPVDSFSGKIGEVVWFPTAFTSEQVTEITSRNLRGEPTYGAPPVTDYSIWWSAKNVDGLGNATLDPDPRVGLWKNLGSLGAAGDAIQATAAAKPILVPSRNTQKQLLNDVITHKHGVKFDGIDDNLAFTSQSFGDFTMISVLRPSIDRDALTAPYDLIINSETSVYPYSFNGIGGLSGFLPNAAFSIGGVDTSPAVYASGTSDPEIVISSNKLSMLTMRLGGKNLTTRIDGVDKKTEDQLVQSGGIDSATQRSLINVNNIGGAIAWGFSSFTLFDTFIFSRALSYEEIILMERFLSEEYPGVEGTFLGFGSAK